MVVKVYVYINAISYFCVFYTKGFSLKWQYSKQQLRCLPETSLPLLSDELLKQRGGQGSELRFNEQHLEDNKGHRSGTGVRSLSPLTTTGQMQEPENKSPPYSVSGCGSKELPHVTHCQWLRPDLCQHTYSWVQPGWGHNCSHIQVSIPALPQKMLI